MKYFCSFIFILFALFAGNAQDPLQKGFRLLEEGDFTEAVTFFENYLQTDPTNKTAQICYGRAVGLSGEPQKANALFANLLNTFPGDFEIQINYNESFLWNKQYEEAKPLYADLVANHPKKFGALLGYANTLSNLKEYPLALLWVDKALILEPENASAKISKKYIKLGYANQKANTQNYAEAIAILEEIFKDFPEDQEVLLNLANIYLIKKEVQNAIDKYERYVNIPKDSITALNGIALAHHIGEKDKEALLKASVARRKVKSYKDYELSERTNDRYVQALIWNRKFIQAKHQIDSLETIYPNRNWIYALKATLGLYTGDAKSSVVNYDAILENDATSFDGNLGSANALFASDRIVPAYKAAFRTLEIFKNQKDALGFIEKLNANYTPYAEEHASYTFDNGNNVAFASNTTVNVPWSTKFRTTLSYQYRTTENTVSLNKANSHIVLAGLDYKLLPKTNVIAIFGFNNSRFMTEAYTQPVLDVKLKMQPFKLQNLELGYQREVQNFNADLIEREIVLNHYGLAYNLGTNINLGWYTQAMYTDQTDGNTRNLLFTSLYYNILRKPALKAGLNYQYISFKDQVPSIYFSPEKYQVVELFSEVRGAITEKTQYNASIATGLQQVEIEDKTGIFRAEAGIKHQLSKRLQGNIYGKYSNIASATAAGFEFTEIGIKLQWMLTKKPLFFDQLNKE